jgi:hypothetical protein
MPGTRGRACRCGPWSLVGQIAATVGLTVVEQTGMAMSDQLKALGLVEYGGELIVKKILASA